MADNEGMRLEGAENHPRQRDDRQQGEGNHKQVGEAFSQGNGFFHSFPLLEPTFELPADVLQDEYQANCQENNNHGGGTAETVFVVLESVDIHVDGDHFGEVGGPAAGHGVDEVEGLQASRDCKYRSGCNGAHHAGKYDSPQHLRFAGSIDLRCLQQRRRHFLQVRKENNHIRTGMHPQKDKQDRIDGHLSVLENLHHILRLVGQVSDYGYHHTRGGEDLVP